MKLSDFPTEAQKRIGQYQQQYWLKFGKTVSVEQAVNDLMLRKNIDSDFNKHQDSDLES